MATDDAILVIPKNAGEQIEVKATRFRERDLIDARVFYVRPVAEAILAAAEGDSENDDK
jgi:hypothetical protein